MSYQQQDNRRSGTVGAGQDTENNALQWGGDRYEKWATQILTITTSAEMTLHVRQAPTEVELSTPLLGLPHQFNETIPANDTQRFIVPADPALPWGKAWVSSVAGGDYVLDGGRRAQS